MPAKPKRVFQTQKFVKNPVVVEAIQFDGTHELADDILHWMWTNDCGAMKHTQPDGELILMISTLEGVMTANAEDYIIRGVEGDFYPCKPSVFNFSYRIQEN